MRRRDEGAMTAADRKNLGTREPADQSGAGKSVLPFCGDFDIRIGRDGTWYYQGTPIGRKPLVKLFASVLRREADGTFWLVTPAERGRIVVDDAPFVAVECEAKGRGEDQVLAVRTNLDEWVEAGPERPLRVVESSRASGSEPSPYVLVRPGLDALIARPVYYQLAELAVSDPQDPRSLGLWSKGRFFRLGSTR
jgi:hypothetical protein